MGKTLYVDNLGDEATCGSLTKLFAAHGTVASARITKDPDTGRSKGLVEMQSKQEAEAATCALNGQSTGGRTLLVREARLRPKDSPGNGVVRS